MKFFIFIFLVIFSSCSATNDDENISNNTQSCPHNFIEVPANIDLNISTFCVMKFEARNNNGQAISTNSGLPWVSINSSDAITACESISEDGFLGKFFLISNPERLTIARNLEGVAQNWSSQIVGTGEMARGHSDRIPARVLEITNINDFYDGTGNSSTDGREQKRTQILSNGEIIWDFAGNVWEWIDWDSNDAGFRCVYRP